MPIGGMKFSRFAAVGLHSYTQSWVNRTTTAGGSISIARQSAVDNFVRGLISAGLVNGTTLSSSVLKYFLLFASDGFVGCNVPLIDVSSVGNATLTNFVSGDYDSTGLTGDGSTKFVNTLFNPSLHLSSNTSGSMGQFSSAGAIGSSVSIFGCQEAGTVLRFSQYFSPTLQGGQIYNEAGQVFIASGYIHGLNFTNRGTTIRLRRDNTLLVSAASPGGSRPNANSFLFAFNNNGVVASFYAFTLRFGFMGNGLSSAQETSLHALTQILIANL